MAPSDEFFSRFHAETNGAITLPDGKWQPHKVIAKHNQQFRCFVWDRGFWTNTTESSMNDGTKTVIASATGAAARGFLASLISPAKEFFGGVAEELSDSISDLFDK